jgi:hypothetical protein
LKIHLFNDYLTIILILQLVPLVCGDQPVAQLVVAERYKPE